MAHDWSILLVLFFIYDGSASGCSTPGHIQTKVINKFALRNIGLYLYQTKSLVSHIWIKQPKNMKYSYHIKNPRVVYYIFFASICYLSDLDFSAFIILKLHNIITGTWQRKIFIFIRHLLRVYHIYFFVCSEILGLCWQEKDVKRLLAIN